MPNLQAETMVPINEVVGAILSETCTNNEILTNQVKNDLKATIYMHYDCNISDEVQMHVVENNANQIALTLPYYSGVEEVSMYTLSNEELENVSAGEVIISLIATALGAIGTALGVGAITIGGIILPTTASIAVGAAVVGGTTALGVGAVGAVATATGALATSGDFGK